MAAMAVAVAMISFPVTGDDGVHCIICGVLSLFELDSNSARITTVIRTSLSSEMRCDRVRQGN